MIQAEGGPVKIGVAVDPHKRLVSLRTGTPYRLSLAHIEDIDDDLRALSVERAAHALLSAAHAHGEWFNVTAEEATAAVQRAIVELRRPLAGRLAPAGVSVIAPSQCRAARGLLRWTQDDLSLKASVSVVTVRNFENEKSAPQRATLDVLQRALESAGVEFIPSNGGGPGVRLREAQS